MFTAKRQAKTAPKTKASATTTTAVPSTKNAFLQGGLKKTAETRSGNNALKYSTTGNEFVDQFTKLGEYKKPRAYADIAKDASTLWGVNPLLSVCFILYLRMITRIVSFFDGTKTTVPQRGAGLKHEAIVRMVWLHVNHRETFWKNIQLFIAVGSWKDVIQMLSYDLQYNDWDNRVLDWEQFKGLIAAGLENPKTSNLLKKYLPQIKSNSQCKTLESQIDNTIAKWICHNLFGDKENGATYKKYRKLKVSGTAHSWQQLISKHHMLEINFDTVHGRALAQMVSGKFIKNNNLQVAYEKWLAAKPVAKFTGYAHELFATTPSAQYQIDTLNKQFLGLVETAQKGVKKGTSMIVVRDTSNSMSSNCPGTKMACGDVAKALALFFSHMLPEGAFANSYIEFNSVAKMCQWKGSTPWEKWSNDHANFVGGTDFQTVINLFCTIKATGIPESEFPTGILCVSDGEFNPASALSETNVAMAFKKLANAGFSKDYINNFKIVLWNLQNSYYGAGRSGNKFETFGDVENVFYFGGYDGSVISFLTGAELKQKDGTVISVAKTAAELFEAAMQQEVLQRVEI
jgi:hypothetical protein